MISDRTAAWFGDKTREELLVEIDRIITTDKPALANLYEELDELRKALAEIARETGEPWTHTFALAALGRST